jgi:hypothetical protein
VSERGWQRKCEANWAKTGPLEAADYIIGLPNGKPADARDQGP